MKKLATSLLMVLLVSGCALPSLPKMPSMPTMPSFGKKAEVTAPSQPKEPEVNVAAMVAAQAAKEAMEKTALVEQKAAEDKKKMEEEYAKLKAETIKAYDDLKKKDQENFDKIAELNYGVYHVTQEKKKIDINTTIAHLRSKEIMMRTDKLSDEKKTAIQKEILEEKAKTVDQLYIQYKATIDLAVNQKAALDEADQLIQQKEKEKTALKEANRIALEKAEAEKKAEVERVRKEAADQVRLLKEAQQAQLIQMMIYGLGGLGIIFLILGVLIRSISFIISAVMFLGLAYFAAAVPMWVIGAVAGVSILGMGLAQLLFKSKKKEASK
jgi:predicted RND superfamily exporter protein